MNATRIENGNFRNEFFNAEFKNGKIESIELLGIFKNDKFDKACAQKYLEAWPNESISRCLSTGVYDDSPENNWAENAMLGNY